MPNSNTTYKNLFSMVKEEIDKGLAYRDTARFRNQLDRDDIKPLISNSVSDLRAGEIVLSIQNLLQESLPQFIINGLDIEAQTPPSSFVTVSAGKASKGGALFELKVDTTLRIPFDTTTGVYLIVLHRDRLMIEKEPRVDSVLLAKIIVPEPGKSHLIYNSKNERPDDWQCYIVGQKEVNLYADNYGNFEEDTIELLRNNFGAIATENLIGNIRLSENLKIINTQGSLEIDSKELRIKSEDDSILAKFNKSGTFYYDEDGKELARFGATGARVGNILVTPNTLESGNYVSGSLGSGFRIEDTGDAEFNNIRARGKLTATTFEKDTVSVIGGSLLVMDGDVLAEDMSSSDASTLEISGDTTFAVNDILRIKDGVEDEWFTVSAVNGNVYTVTRDAAGVYSSNNNPAWKKGTSVVNYGQSGEGGLFLTSSESNGPYMSVLSHAGSPWSTTTTHARFGNLNGFLGYATDTFGIGIGDTDAFLKYDPVGGLQIKGSITITGGDIPSKTFYQDAEPTNPTDDINEGDYWIDTNDGNKLYIFQSSAWEEVAPSSSSTSITVFRQTSIPTATAAGDVWIDTDNDDRLYRATTAGDDQIIAGEWELIKTAIADEDGNVISSVLPGANIGTPACAGLYLGADYMGFYDNSEWKAFIANDGSFAFKGDANNYVSWDGGTMCVRGALNADDIVAGTLCADFIGAGQILLDSGIQIVSNETSGGDCSRTAITSTGIESYDTSGCLKFCLCRGDIYAESIRLQSPDCTCWYSYLDGGVLKFHDEMGEVPYVKRLCSGVACAGDTVVLPGVKNQPDVQVGIKSLKSYDASFSAQDQAWNIYADNYCFYCNCSTDYGYCFDVHAQLELYAATADECVKNSGFGSCVYTSVNTCCTTILSKFNYYCHATAPANWCYGCVCYKYCYRCKGCGVWCDTDDLIYTQPHANESQMQTTYCCSHTICFGASSGPTGCWEILPVIVCVNWADSGIASGSVVCCVCERTVGTNLVGSQACAMIDNNNTCTSCCVGDNDSATLTVSGSNPTDTFCTYLCGTWCSVAPDNFSTCGCLPNSVCERCGFFEGCSRSIISNSGPSETYCFKCTHPSGLKTISYNCEDDWTDSFCNALSSNSITSLTLCTSVYACIRRCQCMGFNPLCIQTAACVCFLGGTLYQCYCTISGSAEGCSYCCLHSLCDVLSSACILDSTGVVNWLAVSYG